MIFHLYSLEVTTIAIIDRAADISRPIMGYAKFANLTYHIKLMHFTVKCHKFEYFYSLMSK